MSLWTQTDDKITSYFEFLTASPPSFIAAMTNGSSFVDLIRREAKAENKPIDIILLGAWEYGKENLTK